MTNLKARFFRTFANLPLGVREEMIIELDGQPITWKALWLDVEADSKVAKRALKILDELKLLRK